MATDVQDQMGDAEGAAATAVASEQPQAPARGDSRKKDSKSSSSKGAKQSSKDAKGAKGAKGSQEAADAPSVAAHPRAAHQVARAKGWGGLVGFALGGYLSLPTHTLVDAGLRALEAGVVCYLAAWAAAVFVWRHLVVIEIKRREQELLAAVQAAHAETAESLASLHPGDGAGAAATRG